MLYNIFFNWPDYISTILGQKWRKNRRLLTPAFHFQILGHFFDVFHKNAEILCKQLSKESFNKEIDVMPYMKRCTLDVICGNLTKERYTSLSIKHTFYICHLKKKEAAMGVKINAQTEDSAYLTAVHKYIFL